MASTPYGAVDIATGQATFLASFRGIPFVFIIASIIWGLWYPRARRCSTFAFQLQFGVPNSVFFNRSELESETAEVRAQYRVKEEDKDVY
jgi:hypothetical protein